MWGPTQPKYGFNGFVQGAVKLSRKCTHVVRVEVSVEPALHSPRGTQLTDCGLFLTAPGKSQSDFVRKRIDF